MINNLDAVIQFAHLGHYGQVRKHSLLPYICHPIDVLNTISSWGIGDDTVRAAAICHDLLEDNPLITNQMLVDRIGGHAAYLVKELTFRSADMSKEQYMASFASKSVQAFAIKVADRCCNTLDFLDHDPSYAKKYWLKALPLLDAIPARRDAIIRIFGIETYQRMMLTIHRTCSQGGW